VASPPAVVGYDGSPQAQAAVRQAVTLLGARPLVIATIWEQGLGALPQPSELQSGVAYMPADPSLVIAVDRAASDHAGDIAEQGARLARELGASAEAVSVADADDVAETLSELADARDAAAIVIGSRAAGGVKARLMGSTSRRLLHDTHRPVIVVRAPD
jgi:nucleotide-binding universal stress UspA family protein